MDNEIIIYENKTNRKYNDVIDFILNNAIAKGWRLVVDDVLILKNNIIVTIVLDRYSIKITPNDFVFSLCFHNKIYISHLETQKYCSKEVKYNE